MRKIMTRKISSGAFFAAVLATAATPMILIANMAIAQSFFSTSTSAGRLNYGTKSFCGATLIDPRLVVTAAHCLSPGGAKINPTDIKFQIFGGKKKVRIAGVAAVGSYRDNRGISINNLAGDIAVLSLAENAPGGAVTKIASMPADGKVRMRPAGSSGAISCTIEEASFGPGGRLAALACPAYKGASGSGVFLENGASRGAVLVGVVSAAVSPGQGRSAASIIVRTDKSKDTFSKAGVR